MVGFPDPERAMDHRFETELNKIARALPLMFGRRFAVPELELFGTPLQGTSENVLWK
jgi:hypothetical protein